MPPQRTLHFKDMGNKGLKKFELCGTAKQVSGIISNYRLLCEFLESLNS